MALSAKSLSADTNFSFFEESASTTANTVGPSDKNETGDVNSLQPGINNQTMASMYTETSNVAKAPGREVTDISFQSIEEVIELESENNGTPETELVNRNNGSSRVQPEGEMIGSPEVKFQIPKDKNLSLGQGDHSRRNGTSSVLSLLSNISLSENKANDDTLSTHKTHADESGSISASQSETNRPESKQDTSVGLDLIIQDKVVDSHDNSSVNTLGIENELSFSWFKSETADRKSKQKTPTGHSPSPTNLLETNNDFDFANEGEIKTLSNTDTEPPKRQLESESEVHMEKDEADSVAISPLPSGKSKKDLDFSWLTSEKDAATTKSAINTTSRPDSNTDHDLSWLTGDTETQESKSEPKKDSFSWLKSGGDEKESELELGERNVSQTNSRKESSSRVTNDQETNENERASDLTGSSAKPNKVQKEISWLRSENEIAKSIIDIYSKPFPVTSSIFPQTEKKEKPGSGLRYDQEQDKSLSRLSFHQFSPSASPTENLSEQAKPFKFSPRASPTVSEETKPIDRSVGDTRAESEGKHTDILTIDKPSSENTKESKQNASSMKSDSAFKIQMKDLNFDFMAEEGTENESPGQVLTRGATIASMSSSQSPSSVLQAGMMNVDDKRADNDTQQFRKTLTLTPNTGTGKVSEAIHSAVELFHHEKDASDIGVNKPLRKQKKKSVRQNGSQQASVRKKTSKTNKVTTGNNAGFDTQEKAVRKQNTKKVNTSKSKNSLKESQEVKVNIEANNADRKKKSQKEVKTRAKESKNDNGNSNRANGYQLPVENSGSSDGQTSTMASSDTVIKIDDMSNYSLAYEDDFEDDTGSVKSAASSKVGFDSVSHKKGDHAFAYSSTAYGGIYSAYARQPKLSLRGDGVKFPKINALNPVQLTSGHGSFKRKRGSKKNEIFTKNSYDYVASSESDNQPEIVLRKNGRVPVSLKAEAVYRKGRLEIAVVDDRQTLSEDANMDVRITVVHKHLNYLQLVRNRPRKLPKLNFATNRDILNHRAALPPFNTHTDKQASERFKQTFGM